MFVAVKMHAYMNGEVRLVDIGCNIYSDTPLMTILERVFELGQNDFQPIADRPSVSVGDVIVFERKYYKVSPIGFTEMTLQEYEDYKNSLPHRFV